MSNEIEIDAAGVPILGIEEMDAIDRFIVAYAKDISKGAKMVRIKGAVIVLDQPTAQPKTGKPH